MIEHWFLFSVSLFVCYLGFFVFSFFLPGLRWCGAQRAPPHLTLPLFVLVVLCFCFGRFLGWGGAQRATPLVFCFGHYNTGNTINIELDDLAKPKQHQKYTHFWGSFRPGNLFANHVQEMLYYFCPSFLFLPLSQKTRNIGALFTSTSQTRKKQKLYASILWPHY